MGRKKRKRNKDTGKFNQNFKLLHVNKAQLERHIVILFKLWMHQIIKYVVGIRLASWYFQHNDNSFMQTMLTSYSVCDHGNHLFNSMRIMSSVIENVAYSRLKLVQNSQSSFFLLLRKTAKNFSLFNCHFFFFIVVEF